MSGILGLIAVLGIVWLVGAATGGNSTGSPNEASAASGTSTAEGTATAGGLSTGTSGLTGDPETQSSQADDGSSPGAHSSAADGGTGSGASHGGRHGLHMNGLHLNGNRGDPGCITVINKTATVGVVESVSYSVVDGPGLATAHPEVAHCSAGDDAPDPPCQNIELRPSGQCLAGVVLTGDPSTEAYHVRATLQVRFMCVNVQDSPCDEVTDWQGSPPTVQNPVEVSGPTEVPTIEAWIDPPSSPSATLPEGSPDNSAPPGSESPSTVPED